MKQCSICLSFFDPFDYMDCPTCREEISRCEASDYIELLGEMKKLNKENDRIIGDSKTFRNESVEIIHDLSADNALLKERIEKLESVVREFINEFELEPNSMGFFNSFCYEYCQKYKELLGYE